MDPLVSDDIAEIVRRTSHLGYEGRRILVTGGAGFLGSTLCESLITLGAEVICVDNLASGRLENLSAIIDNERFRFINHDISTSLDVSSDLDIIFHMASRASPLEFRDYPIQILKSNTLGTWNALGIAKKCGARLLFTSTSEIYGEAEVFPTPETYRGSVNTLGIRGCYDEAKRAGEAYCMAYHRQHQVDVRIVRIFNTYGPRMRSDGVYGRVMPRFISQARDSEPVTIFGDGTQTRSFCYVTDQITGLLTYAAANGLAGEVVNQGNPEEVTILDLAERIKKLLGSQSACEFYPLPQDDPLRRLPDISKARSLYGFDLLVGLDEGLVRMIRGME